jgi:hypothetical protein
MAAPAAISSPDWGIERGCDRGATEQAPGIFPAAILAGADFIRVRTRFVMCQKAANGI